MTLSESVRMIALLRGVNVGGVAIKSADLGEVFTAKGFTGVRTVLASGNVAFDAEGSDVDVVELRSRVEEALAQRFNYDAKIVLLAQQQIAAIAAAYPFARSDQVDHPYVIFSSHSETLAKLQSEAAAMTFESESLAAGADVLYWRVPKGRSLDTPFAKLLAKARFRQSLTTRNLRTVEKLTAV